MQVSQASIGVCVIAVQHTVEPPLLMQVPVSGPMALQALRAAMKTFANFSSASQAEHTLYCGFSVRVDLYNRSSEFKDARCAG